MKANKMMKKNGTILLLCLVCISLTGQKNNIFRLELSIGMNNEVAFRSDHAQGVSIGSSVIYKLRSFDFGLRYEYAITSLGIETPYQLRSNRSSNWHVRSRNTRFAHFSSWQLWTDYVPNFENFKPIIGIGIARNSFTENTFYLDNNLALTEKPSGVVDQEPDPYFTVVYRLGYKIKDVYYRIFLYPEIENKQDKIIGTSISYAFGLSEKVSLPKHSLAMTKYRELSPLFFQLMIGRSLIAPIGKYNAATARYFISSQVLIDKEWYLGFSFEANGSRMGYDEKTVEVIKIEEENRIFIRNTAVSSEISSFKVNIQKAKEYSKNVDFLYGAGIGLYRIEEVGKQYAWGRKFPAEIEKSKNLGLFITTGFRTGIFTNKLEVNIPIGKIPVYIGLQSAIGIHLRKRKKGTGT